MADLSIFQLYCVVMATAALFTVACWAVWGVATDTERQLSPLGWFAIGFASLGMVVGPALYGAYILYSGFN
ncbi:hypothetical protein J7394_00070 [Ruegeria sp. R13_0]|uniref:hypothetical protein n=1 Tax=Ruegeria sp. R13_0 TaxID=2821099 RepID=UPI001ADA080D|nr:hypothetical protein [Ruegeria sp. R13_0]MBO9432579.1 hypothetical protein [Ruegeria sp. R13_0]